jgi:hypothetical protein
MPVRHQVPDPSLIPAAVARRLVAAALKKAGAAPKVEQAVTGEVNAGLDGIVTILGIVDRITTATSMPGAAATQAATVYANGVMNGFSDDVNGSFMPELIRAQNIGAEVVVWFHRTATGNVIQAVAVCPVPD